MSQKPIVAITMGDPVGIGPEIVLKALSDPRIRRSCYPLILGDQGVLQRARAKKRSPEMISWQEGQPLKPLLDGSNGFVVCPLSALSAKESRSGIPSVAGGDAAYRYICLAAKLALAKTVDAIATAPISKSILQ